MRLSTKTRYGVRAIFDIAYHAHGNPPIATQASDIARRESIPRRYLEQVFQDLRRAGLVDSKRGPRGGYSLKRPPEQITLGQVVRALQGPVEDLFEIQEDGGSKAGPSTQQLTAALWGDLARHVRGWFDSVTIADLVKRGRAMGIPRAGIPQPMYFI